MALRSTFWLLFLVFLLLNSNGLASKRNRKNRRNQQATAGETTACDFQLSALVPTEPSEVHYFRREWLSRPSSGQTVTPRQASKKPSVQDTEDRSLQARQLGNLLDFKRVRETIEILSGVRLLPETKETLPDRYTDSNKAKIRSFLFRYLTAMGYSVNQEAHKNYLDGAFTNLIAEVKGTEFPEEVIEVSAHFDTTDYNRPGADDNGSGIALVLELARLFQLHPPSRTVRFVFDDLEEQGACGSCAHTQLLRERNERLYGAFIIDMIGYYPKGARLKWNLCSNWGNPGCMNPLKP